MKTKFQKIMGLTAYQDHCQAMVAPPGISRKPKKVKGAKRKASQPFRDEKGIAQSKTLRKREARLWARQQNAAMTNNANPTPPAGAYRKPGSMTK